VCPECVVAATAPALQELVPDRVLAPYLTPTIDPAMIDVPAPVRAANPLLRAYWTVARRLL
jgi:hypothetical protein